MSGPAIAACHPSTARMVRPAPRLLADGLEVDICASVGRGLWLQVPYGPALTVYRRARLAGLTAAEAYLLAERAQ